MDPSLLGQLKSARDASRSLGRLTGETRSALVLSMATSLMAARDEILSANALDVERAVANAAAPSMLDRLRLNSSQIGQIISDMQSVAALPDPIGKTLYTHQQAEGLSIRKVSVPLGVVGVVYEARPNVTTDIAALCIRSGNGIVLRGGSETIHTNKAMVDALKQGLAEHSDALQFINDTNRDRVIELITADQYIDVLIPRGGAALGRLCCERGTVPVIVGGAGVCHLFLDESAEPTGALEVILNAKTQRTSVCNALDTLLIHANVMANVGIAIASVLHVDGVCIHADDAAGVVLERHGVPYLPVTEADLATEWLGMHINLVVVDGISDAMSHIQRYGSHSDGILTEDPLSAERFVSEVDSPAVFVNASTRFHDGGQFGLGAEVAVSTQKVHARGPLGLEALTSAKWIVSGAYHCRG